MAHPPAPNAASRGQNAPARGSASACRSPVPAAAASAPASAGAPSHRRKAWGIPLENSSRPVLAAQVYRVDSSITARKPRIPYRGSSTATPASRSTASHTL